MMSSSAAVGAQCSKCNEQNVADHGASGPATAAMKAGVLMMHMHQKAMNSVAQRLKPWVANALFSECNKQQDRVAAA